MKTKIYILSLLGGLLLTMVACLNDGKTIIWMIMNHPLHFE